MAMIICSFRDASPSAAQEADVRRSSLLVSQTISRAENFFILPPGSGDISFEQVRRSSVNVGLLASRDITCTYFPWGLRSRFLRMEPAFLVVRDFLWRSATTTTAIGLSLLQRSRI